MPFFSVRKVCTVWIGVATVQVKCPPTSPFYDIKVLRVSFTDREDVDLRHAVVTVFFEWIMSVPLQGDFLSFGYVFLAVFRGDEPDAVMFCSDFDDMLFRPELVLLIYDLVQNIGHTGLLSLNVIGHQQLLKARIFGQVRQIRRAAQTAKHFSRQRTSQRKRAVALAQSLVSLHNHAGHLDRAGSKLQGLRGFKLRTAFLS